MALNLKKDDSTSQTNNGEDEKKSKFKRQILNEKYNDHSFKPKINAQSQNVQSRVFQNKTQNLDD